jgi:nucleoside-diphosphate-sugar epimerase
MRVAVTGATGNLGTAVLRALAADPAVDCVVGIARRRPELELPKVVWRPANVATDDLAPLFEGAKAVFHLAWLIQPSRDPAALRAVNVDGSRRVFDAAAVAKVERLLYASSVGAYSEGPKDRLVDESWGTEGVRSSFYSRHKAEVEAMLDRYESRHPEMGVVRLRPGLIFQRPAATAIRRLFLGPLFPNAALRAGIPIVPDIPRLRFQAVHADDVAEAFRLCLHDRNAGAFNIAAEPVLDPRTLAEALDARRVRLPAFALRGAAALSWRLHLQPSPEGWLDLALAVPTMSTERARTVIGWRPRRSASEALLELIAGLYQGSGFPTPPLDPGTSGPFRAGELRTGVGSVSL